MSMSLREGVLFLLAPVRSGAESVDKEKAKGLRRVGFDQGTPVEFFTLVNVNFFEMRRYYSGL